MSDLKGRLTLREELDALDVKAAQGEWTVRQHTKSPATAKHKALDRVKLSTQIGPLGGFERADGELAAALVNAYRSGQLVPLPEVEELAKVYADATDYYIPYHRGLSSPSADKLRAGITAIINHMKGKE